MTGNSLGRWVKVFLIIAGGLFFGLVAVLTLSQWHAGRAFAAVTATCTSDSSGNVTVTLNNDSTVQLTVGTSSSTNFLQLVGASSPNCEPAASVASITFALGTASGPVTVILSETGTAPIPCVPLEGTIGGSTLQVSLAANDVANFGTTGVNVNLSTGNSCAATDTLSGISAETAVATAAPVMVGANGGADGSPSAVTFTASPSANAYSLAGDVDLVGSAGTYTIASTGAGNAVNAGSGSETFTINGNGVDVTAGSGTDTFTLTGSNDSVMGGTGTDTFTVKGSGTAILGVSGGTYTVNNSGTGTVVTGGPGTESFTITGNTAPFTGSAGGTYTLNLPAGSDVTAGSGTETFTITDPAGGYSLIGSSDSAATTTFTVQGTPTSSAIGDDLEGGAGTTSFTLNSNGSTLDGSSGPSTFNITGNDNSYEGGSGADQVTITGNSNDFHAGTGTEKFFGVASSPSTNPGDTVDFSGIGASSSAPLVVNVSGASETVSGVLVSNGQATLIPSSGSTYTFRDSSSGAGATTALDFTTIIGSTEGSTQFLAGSSGGLTFTGSGSGNQASFFGSSGVVVNVSGALQTTSAQIGTSTQLSGFQIGSGQALVSPPTGGLTSCSGSGGSAIAPFCDVITDVFTATGPASGFSTFYAGAPPQTYTFSDAGNNNTFIGGTGTANFSSGGNFNTFEAGLGTENFSESTTSQEPDNTIDFSNVPVGSQAGCTSAPCSLSVNVSGTQTSVSNFSADLFNKSQAQVATYSFGSGGSDFTNFIGAAGGDTTFAGGSGNYTYTGQGIGNTLDFSDVPSATASVLTFDVTHIPSPQATLGTVPETFSGITNLVGLATGSTTFVGGSTGGYTFNGKGSGNQATFSAQGPSTTLTVQINQSGTNTPVTSGTVTFSLAGGSTLCSAVPVDGSGHSSCFAAALPGGSDQVLAVYTPPAGSSQSGSGVLITASGTGTASTPTTTTLTDAVPTGSCMCQNQTLDFTATVTSKATVSGTVTFSLAGGQTLCSAVPVASGTAACDVGLPAGVYDVLAVFTPNGSTLAGSAATPLALNIATPSASSVSVAQVSGSLQATITAPAGTIGTVTFNSDLGQEFSESGLQVGSNGTLTVTIPEFVSIFTTPLFVDGQQAIVTFTPSTGAVSQSAGVSPVITGGFSDQGFFGSTSTTLSSNGTGTISTGTQVTFTTTVSATSGTLPSPVLPGGIVTFAVVGGATLCNVQVPSGVTSAQLQCSGSLPAGTDDIIATYNPSNGLLDTDSAAVLVLSVAAPAGTTASAGSPTTDGSSGAVVNLSTSTYTTSATASVPNVSLSSGEVLVAAPPTPGASCAVSPLPTFCDSLVGISNVTGSSGGDNTFVAGPAPETFQDSGSAGGDTVDFTHVSTSSTTPLVVNASGATQSGFSPFTASENSTTLYTFSSNGPDFTNFIGSSSGNTEFLAGSLPGYTFSATGGSNAGNSIDFSAISTGVTVNLMAGTSGTVTWLSGADSDTISGLTTVTGSTSASASSPNVFEGGSATYTFTGEGTSNDFKVGTGSETIIDSGPGNTVDFSGLTTAVTVNVSGTQVGSTINDSASTTGANYTFTSFGTTAATFIGSAGGTTFDAGTAADTFNGQGLANDTLSYANGTLGGPLTVCVVAQGTCAAGEAVLGSVNQFFSGIKVFFGLATGNTTFVAGDATGSFTFNAPASNGKVDFSNATAGINANLATGLVTLHSGTTDTILGMTTVLGSKAGHNTFVAGPAPETFGDTGSTGGDTIDFTHVSTSSSTPLVVNTSGATINGFTPYTATEGLTPLYTFSNSGPNFTTFIGAATGSTEFLAGSLPGYSFTGVNAGNSIDFSAISTGVTVNLTGGTSGTVTWLSGTDSDSINGLTTVTGSSAGFNVFEGGSSTYNFTAGGPDNDFKVGTGSETINDTGPGNTVDFSGLTTPVTVNVSGSLVGSTSSDTASTTGAIYTFTSFGSTATTFVGSAGGTTFDAGTAADTFDGRGLANDTLSYANGTLGGPLTVCVVAQGTCAAGEAVLGSVDQFFSGIKVFSGLAIGSTTFVAGDATGGFTFNAPASNGKVDLSSAGNGINANLTTGTVTLHSGATDTISGISTVFGSTAGHNTFVAGTAPETFGDTGSAGGDTIDFTHVSTSSSTPLVVNASGATTNGFSPYTATEGLTPLYTFSSNGANFTTFIGSSVGNTEFLAGSLPGYTFNATGVNAGNSVDFSAVTTGVTVNLTTGTSGTVSWLGGGDSISGLTTVTGSSSGSNVFEGGPGPSIYAFSSSGPNNDFKVGTGSETINATGAGSTIDFSGLTTPLTVNVSGSLVGSTGTDTASTAGATYTFTSFGANAATFIGSAGGTTFDAGTAADIFTGQGLANDTLSYANGSLAGPLTVCVVAQGSCTAGEALLGSVKEFFSGIKVFSGLTSGATTFVAGDSSGGYTFNAPSNNGKVDFSTASAGINANLNTGTVTLHGGATDSITGITSVFGSTAGHNTFVAGPSSATFGDNGTAGGDAVDFSNLLSTSSGTPLIINVSGATVNVSGSNVSSYTATVGSGTTFTLGGNGPDFTTFTGAGTGNTRFIAPNGAGGYTFTGKATGNTADFSANLQGIVVNLSPSSEAGLTTGQVQVAPAVTDAISDMATVIGSPTGSNVFYSGLLGTSFLAQSPNNELSYKGLTTTGVIVNLKSGTAALSQGATNTDTFNFGTGSVTVQGSTGNDTFVIGTSPVVLQGGGGQDAIDLSQVQVGVTVNLQAGVIAPGTGFGGVTYTPGCSSATALCVTSVTGTPQADTFIAGALSTANPATITGNGGNDTLNLADIPQSATVVMPITTLGVPAAGYVTSSISPAGQAPPPVSGAGITFSGVSTLSGTAGGGDHVYAGTGTETLTESGTTATLDFSADSNSNTGTAGVSITANDVGGLFSGSVSSPVTLNVTDMFTGFRTFVGTQGDDTFVQSGPSPARGYVFSGEAGNNTLNLSAAPTGTTVALSTPVPADGCTGSPNNDGTASDGLVLEDTFSCVGIVNSTSTYTVAPGQTASINGGGSGTLELDNSAAGQGATINLLTGTVTGDGFSFSFTGMTTVVGTAGNDTFIAGPGNYSLIGGGGSDTLNFSSAPAAEDVNLSGSSFTVGSGASAITIPAFTAMGGYGGNLSLQGISNVVSTRIFSDVVVAANSGVGYLEGGSGSDRFVLTGGFDYIAGGTGTYTLDLSDLPGPATLDLAESGAQSLGPGNGDVWILSGNIGNVLAPNSGSTLIGGRGPLTLTGGTGSDTLIAGDGNQTLIGGGGTDVLEAGVGNDTLEGGADPVTFVPGAGNGTPGSGDTLTSQTTGNTLSYAGAPNPVVVSLFNANYTVPTTLKSTPANTLFGGKPTVANTATGGWGATVHLGGAGVTNVIGTGGNDIFVTDPTGFDDIQGGGGSDLFVIKSGSNTLTAGTGSTSDFLFAGVGDSNQIFGGGASTVDFSQAPAGVQVILQPESEGSATGGFGGSQSLSGVLNIVGTASNDVLVAGAKGATVIGLNGSDFLQAGPTGGDTLISDGVNPDTFCAMTSCEVDGTVARGGDTMTGGTGNDEFFALNGVVDTINGAGGFNYALVDTGDKVTNIQTTAFTASSASVRVQSAIQLRSAVSANLVGPAPAKPSGSSPATASPASTTAPVTAFPVPGVRATSAPVTTVPAPAPGTTSGPPNIAASSPAAAAAASATSGPATTASTPAAPATNTAVTGPTGTEVTNPPTPETSPPVSPTVASASLPPDSAIPPCPAVAEGASGTLMSAGSTQQGPVGTTPCSQGEPAGSSASGSSAQGTVQPAGSGVGLASFTVDPDDKVTRVQQILI